MKIITALLAAFLLGAFQVQAYDIDATYQLIDTQTLTVIQDLTDGTQVDLHLVPNRKTLGIRAAFAYENGNEISGHTSWVEWEISHSKRTHKSTHKTLNADRDLDYWPVCQSRCSGP